MKKAYIFVIFLLFMISRNKEGFVNGTDNLPEYEPEKWNSPEYIKTNNCYAYVLNDLRSRNGKPQPGRYSKVKGKDKYASCDSTFKRVQSDNPGIYKVDGNESCKEGYYKGFLAMDPGKDYHFYRQDKNKMWSHKPGKNKATNLDSVGNKITDPRLANRIYKKYKYTTECNFMCIPENTNAE